ncbi:unnamed protein product [Arctogadus glacialis]
MTGSAISRRHPERFLSPPLPVSGALLSTGISGKRDRNTVDGCATPQLAKYPIIQMSPRATLPCRLTG